MKSKYLVRGETINSEGLSRDEDIMLAFINRGVVSIESGIDFNERYFKEWEYLGQREFFFGGKVVRPAKVKTFTRINYFLRSDLLRIL